MTESTKTSGVHDPAEEVDGLLLRYLDGELSATEEGKARALLASSSDARRRMAELRASSALFSDQLGGMPIPAVPGFSMPEVSTYAPSPDGLRFAFPSFLLRHRMAAAMALFLLTLGFMAPVRAWIAESVRTVASILAPSEASPPPVAEGEAGPSTVSFVPLGDELLVSVGSYQASGRLTVVVVEGSRVSGETSVQGTAVELLVLPNGIEVRNGPGSVADYTIEVPQTLQRVRVRAGGRELGVGIPAEVAVGHTWVFDLTDPGG